MGNNILTFELCNFLHFTMQMNYLDDKHLTRVKQFMWMLKCKKYIVLWVKYNKKNVNGKV